jgi:hypothetical protein
MRSLSPERPTICCVGWFPISNLHVTSSRSGSRYSWARRAPDGKRKATEAPAYADGGASARATIMGLEDGSERQASKPATAAIRRERLVTGGRLGNSAAWCKASLSGATLGSL